MQRWIGGALAVAGVQGKALLQHKHIFLALSERDPVSARRGRIATARALPRRASSPHHLPPSDRAHLLGRQILDAQESKPSAQCFRLDREHVANVLERKRAAATGFGIEPMLNFLELLAVASPRRIQRLYIAADGVLEHREQQSRLAIEHRAAPS